MFFNVIVLNSIYKMTDKGLDLFKRSCAYMQPKGNNPRIKIIRHVITYDNHIVLITNNCPELKNLITLIKASLECVGLGLADNKTQLVSFINSTYNKIKFDYAGFTFLYMPKKKNKKRRAINPKGFYIQGKGSLCIRYSFCISVRFIL